MANMLRGGKNNQKKVRKLATPIDPDTPKNFLIGEARASFYEGCICRRGERSPPQPGQKDESYIGLCRHSVSTHELNGNWVSVAFYSRKMHELNYGIHDQELLASDWSYSTNGVTTSKARSC
jgi:hypothetical protein